MDDNNVGDMSDPITVFLKEDPISKIDVTQIGKESFPMMFR